LPAARAIFVGHGLGDLADLVGEVSGGQQGKLGRKGEGGR
jgi:hypothetical protein